MINQYIDDFNLVNARVTEGRLTDIEKLENMSVEEYYSTINSFLKIEQDKPKT
jgi:hypothetical protein